LTRPVDRPAARHLARAGLVLLLAAGASRPLWAQDQALVVSIHGGRHSPLVNLTDGGDDLAAAFSYGGGVALQLNPNVAIRALTTYHSTRYRGTAVTPADSGMAQFVFGGDLLVGWPATSVFVPYIFFGGGAVLTDFDDPSQDTSTRFSGRFGVGLNRVSGFGAWFLEIDGLLYQFEGLGLRRTQFDVEAKLGLAIALGL
jgi:hypothetical protein